MFSFEAMAMPQAGGGGVTLHNAQTDSPSPTSEQSSPTDDGSFNHLNDFDDGDDSLDQPAAPKRKSRRPPSTAERRATHNAVERARRESLNGRFMDLAGALPNMANVKRPSKSVIVAKSLEFVQGACAREQQLISQNDNLRQELNELRARMGMTPVAASPMPVQGRPREHSIVSSDASSLIGTPSSNNGSFDNASNQQAKAPSSANQPAFPFTMPFGFVDKPSSPSGLSASPPSAAAFPQAPGLPVVDVNYPMALSLQHQQQQNFNQMLSMQNRGGQATGFPTAATAAPWGMPLGMPVSGNANTDTNWLFA